MEEGHQIFQNLETVMGGSTEGLTWGRKQERETGQKLQTRQRAIK